MVPLPRRAKDRREKMVLSYSTHLAVRLNSVFCRPGSFSRWRCTQHAAANIRDQTCYNWCSESDNREPMTLSPVSLLLNSLFNIARTKYSAEHAAWVDLSFRFSGRFGLVTALSSIQREGDLDLLLRCLEDELDTKNEKSVTAFSFHHQMMFSEVWIVGCYEILRAFRQRDWDAAKAGRATSGVSELDEFKAIFVDFELLRMPIAKYQIAKDDKLKQPLPMRRVGAGNDKPIEFYDPKDPERFHIMPGGVSERGSAMWLALDGRNSREHWIERRKLADRLLALVGLVKGAGELEAEQRAANKAARR